MNDSGRSSPETRSDDEPHDADPVAARGDPAPARASQHSVLQELQERTRARLGVHLDSPVEAETPVKVTDEVRALRDPAGRYQMLGEIGRGGVGIVYKGRDQDLGRDVAMKVLKDEHAGRADVLARFVEEAQIGGQLQHPGIVPVYELGLHAGARPYFAMKLVKGETLAVQLARRGAATEDRRRLLGIFEQVCQTMAYAHARRVVHRDLKPANVMIGAFGEVQVVDWGFAKVFQRNDTAEEVARVPHGAPDSVIETARSRTDSSSHSMAGSMMGTPAYMPPEQAQGDVARVDERSDVFALGAILCELLTGDAPYREQDGDLIHQAAHAELDKAYARLAACTADEALIALCTECLSPSQRARPASAGQVAGRMSAYLTSVEERARAAQVRAAEARLKHRVTLMSAAAGLVVLALGAGGLVWVGRQAELRRTAAAQRVASAMSTASGARGRAQSAGLDTSLWSAAVVSAEQLVSLARGDDVDPSVRSEARALLAAVSAESRAAEVESDRRARDEEMLARLETLRIPTDEDVRANRVKELRRLDQAYADAFAAYLGGTSPLAQASEATLSALRQGDIETELAASLDHWGLVRDALKREPGAPEAAGTARIREVATLLDPDDPWRARLRALLPNADQEGARLRELGAQADLGALPAAGCGVLSQALWSAGEKEASVDVLSRAQELHPRDFELCFHLGLALDLLDEPRTAEALAAYRIAHAIRPEQNEVLHRQLLGLKLLERRVDEERIARLLVTRDPGNAHWHLHLGFALAGQGRRPDAIASFRRAVELDPASAIAHTNLAVELSEQGEADEALASFRRAAELEPRTADMHVNLGNAWLTMGELDEAVACYRRAIELDPRSTTAHDYLGMALGRQGHAEEALASFRRASELDPRFAQAHANAGEVLVALGRPEEAALSFGRALELAPRNPNNHNNLGQALILQGEWHEATASFRRALELDPGFAPAHVNLGLTLTRSGELEEALHAYREAEALFAQDSSAFGRQWHEAAGRSADELEQRLELVPELDEVLAGRRAASSEEWNLAVQHGYDRRRHADVVALTERTLQDAPELIDDVLGLYNSACSAALLDARSAASVDDAERARARGLARAWLGREVERWVAVRERAGGDAAAALGSLKHALEDPDFASVRGAALEGLPASEQGAWRELWERIEDAAAR